MEKTREYLKSIGLPEGDAYQLPTSEKRFADGGQYRFEVPGIQGPKVMKALLEAIDSYGLYLHRVTQTQGIMRLTDEEISKMVDLAHQVAEKHHGPFQDAHQNHGLRRVPVFLSDCPAELRHALFDVLSGNQNSVQSLVQNHEFSSQLFL